MFEGLSTGFLRVLVAMNPPYHQKLFRQGSPLEVVLVAMSLHHLWAILIGSNHGVIGKTLVDVLRIYVREAPRTLRKYAFG